MPLVYKNQLYPEIIIKEELCGSDDDQQCTVCNTEMISKQEKKCDNCNEKLKTALNNETDSENNNYLHFPLEVQIKEEFDDSDDEDLIVKPDKRKCGVSNNSIICSKTDRKCTDCYEKINYTLNNQLYPEVIIKVELSNNDDKSNIQKVVPSVETYSEVMIKEELYDCENGLDNENYQKCEKLDDKSKISKTHKNNEKSFNLQRKCVCSTLNEITLKSNWNCTVCNGTNSCTPSTSTNEDENTTGKLLMQQFQLTRIERVHGGNKVYECYICRKTFSQQGDLIRHVRTHTGEKPYKCDICDKTFSQQGNLSKHTSLHTGVRSFECNICGKLFLQRFQLNRHERTHTGEKPYECDMCPKTFSQQSHLNIHKKVHNSNRPYQCNICYRSFSELHFLNKHDRMCRGEKRFHCIVCNKSFARQCYLTVHFRIHTGERPYQCDICDKAFSQQAHLMIHKKVHTNEKPVLFVVNQFPNEVN